jgi:hypothetical protein
MRNCDPMEDFLGSPFRVGSHLGSCRNIKERDTGNGNETCQRDRIFRTPKKVQGEFNLLVQGRDYLLLLIKLKMLFFLLHSVLSSLFGVLSACVMGTP